MQTEILNMAEFHINIACTVSEMLAQIDHKGLNWTFLSFENDL